MKRHEFTAGRVATITALIALVTACIYLALAVGAGSTQYQCRAEDSCSKTIVRKCRKCDLQSSTVAGILGEMHSRAACPPGSFRSASGRPSAP